jgi:hypothetical protein
MLVRLVDVRASCPNTHVKLKKILVKKKQFDYYLLLIYFLVARRVGIEV